MKLRSLKNIDRILIGRRTGYEVKRWRFPLTTQCPEPKCRRQCRSRELAINHYKTRHADRTVLCSVCENPYSVEIFASHFTDAHPGYYLPIPTLPGTFASQSTSKHSSAQRKSDHEYIVTLSDGNKWPFPRITWCPHRGCPESFMFRKDALNHYNKQHAPTVVLCTLCKPQKPITNSVIPLHYATAHPGAEVAPDWKQQIKKECKVCQKMLSSQQSLFHHKATQHHIGKYKCPHNECAHTESNRSRINTHWEKRHAHTSMKDLCEVRPSNIMKRKRGRRVIESTTESSVASTSEESDSTMAKSQSNENDSDASAARKKSKRISIIDDPKIFCSSVELIRLSHGKWTVQTNVPEEEPKAAEVAASARENVHVQSAIQSNNVPREKPEKVLAAPQVNYSSQTSKPNVQSAVQLMTYEPQAGSSQNVYEFVFIKTEHPDYLEEVTFIDENNAIDEDEDDDGDDIIDLTECEDEDDVIYICD